MFDFDTFAKKVSRDIREGKSIPYRSQLIIEVVDSKRNRDYFYQKFCQLTIDLNDLHRSDSSIANNNLPEKELLRKEGIFIIKQLEKNKIYVSADFLGPIYDLMVKADLSAFFAHIRQQFYASAFANFKNVVMALAKNKYANSNISAEVLKLLSYYTDYCVWYVSDYKSKKVTVQLARVFADALFTLIIGLFNTRRAVLPKKDVFNYAANLYNLIDTLDTDLAARRSQRETKKGDAGMADIRACTVYKDNKVLVIEPKRLIKGPGDKEGLRRSAEMCHTYFGIYRTSLVTGNTVQGANWCTAVGPEPVSHSQPGSMYFLDKYLFQDGNNLYYFIDLREDKIYALRTCGSDPHGVENAETCKKIFPNDSARAFRRIMMSCTKEVTSAVGSSLGPVTALLQKFNLTDVWAQKYITFVDNSKHNEPTPEDREKEEELIDDPDDLWAVDEE